MYGTRPRAFAEWKALRRWSKLPAWELDSPGYLIRLAREQAGLTQTDLAKRLGCSQQAVAQAERWDSNPTIEFVREWAAKCGMRIRIHLDRTPRMRSKEGTRKIRLHQRAHSRYPSR